MIELLKVNPITFYSVLQNSNTDRFFEFNGNSFFFNIVIPADWIKDSHIIAKFVQKGKIGVVFLNDVAKKTFDIEKILTDKYGFSEQTLYNPNIDVIPEEDSSRPESSSIKILKK